MIVDEAVKLMDGYEFPWFGIIVENKDECLNFLDKLEEFIPQLDQRVATDGHLRNFAFKGNEVAVAVTLSKYRCGYDRWSGYGSAEDLLTLGKNIPGNVRWVMWNEIRFSANEEEFVNLL